MTTHIEMRLSPTQSQQKPVRITVIYAEKRQPTDFMLLPGGAAQYIPVEGIAEYKVEELESWPN